MSDIRIDLDGIVARFDNQEETSTDVKMLIGEVRRLDEVNKRWASAWKKIQAAHAEAFMDRITYLEKRVADLEKLL